MPGIIDDVPAAIDDTTMATYTGRKIRTDMTGRRKLVT
jgi:hypothetical protein